MKYIIFMYMDSCKKYNGCIFLISARKNLLKTCLEYLDENYNNQFNYPILIFYHGDKYDDENFRESIGQINKNTKYSFHKLEAKLPSHLEEEDLFYNLKNNNYVKNNFPKSRLGYLHANFFWNNFMNYEELKSFDYLIRIDDDSWFKNKIDFDFFEKLNESNKLVGCAYTWNNVHSRVLETRYKFFKWIKSVAKKFNIEPINQNLKNYLRENENDIIENIKCHKNFHSMKFLCGNCNIYNRKMFETEEWKNYLSEFNKIAGGFRYRWGDCELISMFYYLYIGEEFLDLDLINRNLYNNQINNKWHTIRDDAFFTKSKKKNKEIKKKNNNLLLRKYKM